MRKEISSDLLKRELNKFFNEEVCLMFSSNGCWIYLIMYGIKYL